MIKVVKTTFEQKKDEAWLKLPPSKRLEITYKVVTMIRNPETDYSYKSQKVIIKKYS